MLALRRPARMRRCARRPLRSFGARLRVLARGDRLARPAATPAPRRLRDPTWPRSGRPGTWPSAKFVYRDALAAREDGLRRDPRDDRRARRRWAHALPDARRGEDRAQLACAAVSTASAPRSTSAAAGRSSSRRSRARRPSAPGCCAGDTIIMVDGEDVVDADADRAGREGPRPARVDGRADRHAPGREHRPSSCRSTRDEVRVARSPGRSCRARPVGHVRINRFGREPTRRS